MSDSMKEVVDALDPVTQRILPPNIDIGTLVPLKTTLELRDNLTLGLAYITRAPTKCTNDVVNVVRSLVGDDVAKNLPHLRRCSKPGDLPNQLKAQFMNVGQYGRHIHTGKSQWLYIMLGPRDHMPYEELVKGLSTIDDIRDDLFVGIIPVPLLAPTSQVQANMWSQQFWQTVYRKNNPLGPHPSNICRTTTLVARDASVWMNLAHKIAKEAQKSGLGEPIGAVIIKRTVPGKTEAGRTLGVKTDAAQQGGSGNPVNGPGQIPKSEESRSDEAKEVDSTAGVPNSGTLVINDANQDTSESDAKETTTIVALAADARWHCQGKTGRTGNPMAHAALRAISMVAQKLVRAEKRESSTEKTPIMEFEAFQDLPLLEDERTVYEEEHPSPDGYLCHDLELYMTHEPCTMCAMAILHSRMGRIVYRQRMPLTGGMSSEDRGYDMCGMEDTCDSGPCGGGQGLGLHWRKELNWSMLGWEWETDQAESLPVDAHLHA